MLSLLLAASLGGQPACQAATGYGYAQSSYVATPHVTQGYAAQYAAPTYYNRVVTAFVPIVQQDYSRTEIVGDQARAAQYAQARLAADTELVNAIKGVTTTLGQFAAQVKQATQVQDQAFQAKQQAPAPVAQYPVQPSPQQPQSPAPPSKSAPADYGQVPEPPQASPQAPAKGFPSLPPVNVPPPPTDAVLDQQGTFPTQPTQPTQPTGPTGFQAAPSGPLSPAMQAATQIVGTRCGSCHGPNGSGGVVLLPSKDRLASYEANFLKMLAQVAYRGYVLQPDGSKLRMPPNGRSLSQDEFAAILRAQDEADQAATLASNGGGR